MWTSRTKCVAHWTLVRCVGCSTVLCVFSCSYCARQGCILLVDATRGIQAQTMSNFYLAFGADLAILPIINKIDVDTADVHRVQQQLKSTFSVEPSQCLLVCCCALLQRNDFHVNFVSLFRRRQVKQDKVCQRCCPRLSSVSHRTCVVTRVALFHLTYSKWVGRPGGDRSAPCRLRVFDSWFDPYRGSVCLVNVVDGMIKTGRVVFRCLLQ